MSPGKYLQLRRAHTGLGLIQAAATMAALPWTVRNPGPTAKNRAHARLLAAEEDREHFTLPEVESLGTVIPLDPQVYVQLVDLHLAGPTACLPRPQVCRECACSWMDPCLSDHAEPCAWAEANLCTTCAEREIPALQIGEAA